MSDRFRACVDAIVGCALLSLIAAVVVAVVVLIADDPAWLLPMAVLGGFVLIGRSVLCGGDDE